MIGRVLITAPSPSLPSLFFLLLIASLKGELGSHLEWLDLANMQEADMPDLAQKIMYV